MKKFFLSLAIAVLAMTAVNAQTTGPQEQVKKECCKEGKMEGKKCDKPADQQCPDCKAQAAAQEKDCCKDKMAEGKKCDKAEGMKHECKKAEGQCPKEAAAAKKDCCKDKMAEGKKCDKAEGMKHECKKAEGQCPKDATAAKKDCCKDKMAEGKKCDKPADQQCPDCKEKAKKN